MVGISPRLHCLHSLQFHVILGPLDQQEKGEQTVCLFAFDRNCEGLGMPL